MKVFVTATFSGGKGDHPAVTGYSPEELLQSDVEGVLQAFLQGGMKTLTLVMMKEKGQ